MATLDHESVVKLLEVYEGENTFYLVLEYLKGSSLHDLTTRGAALNWDQIKSVLFVFIYYIISKS